MVGNIPFDKQKIIPGVSLSVDYRSGIASLVIGKNLIEFDWNEDAYNIFGDIDNADPIELLAVIAQNVKKHSFN